jgi:DnaJ-class molecular chaperone
MTQRDNINVTQHREYCPACDGQGKEFTTDTCPACHGNGKERGYDFKCKRCDGAGVVRVKIACSLCWGTGVINVQKRAVKRIFDEPLNETETQEAPQATATRSAGNTRRRPKLKPLPKRGG